MSNKSSDLIKNFILAQMNSDKAKVALSADMLRLLQEVSQQDEVQEEEVDELELARSMFEWEPSTEELVAKKRVQYKILKLATDEHQLLEFATALNLTEVDAARVIHEIELEQAVGQDATE